MAVKYIKYKEKKPLSREEKIKFELALKELDGERAKALRRARRRSKLAGAIGLFVYIALMAVSIYFIMRIPSSRGFWNVLIVIGKSVLVIAAMFFNAIIAFYPFSKIYSAFYAKNYGKRALDEERKKFTEKYRQFYGLPQDYILTACYKCFDKSFSGKPVCLFRRGGKLCMTADIVNGFINGSRDKGLYETDFSSIEKIERTTFEGKNAYRIIAEGKETVFAWRSKYVLFESADCAKPNRVL